jgi:iron complex outermembrane receptor protein
MMLRMFGLSLVCIAALNASESLGTIDVEEKIDTTVVKDVRGEEIRSADLGEALSKEKANINISRRSGIANDILIRGQKKDNITVTVDGAKVCGACPNRMDPPISHVLSNNVDYIEINEGPFNVTDFGSLSADVKAHTLKPTKETHGEVSVNAGSWDYLKGAFMLSGGTDKLRFLLSGSAENGSQYKDGNGDDFVEQIAKAIIAGHAVTGNQYQAAYQNLDAFSKKTLMGKLYWDLSQNQELELSYTMNRSDNVLYPNTPMDAVYDDSDVLIAKYTAKDLGTYSKKLTLDAYKSTVDHPMSTKYRNSGTPNYMTSHLETQMEGLKLANMFDVSNHEITAGIDANKRNWDGRYYRTYAATGVVTPIAVKSINDVDTTNKAIFAKDKIKVNESITFELGGRYDSTDIDKAKVKQRDFDDLSAYALGTYSVDKTLKVFAGAGRSNRVPDAKELYFTSNTGTVIGNPNLDNVTNNEIDFGFEKKFENFDIKSKLFYSKLDNFIAYNATSNKYENVDASLYGIEMSGSWYATEKLTIDAGMAYQRGTKDDPLTGQTDTNLPDISPLKVIIGATYNYNDSLKLEGQLIAAAPWSQIDDANGEQKLDGYNVINLKATKNLGSGLEFVVGVDNLLDETYAVSNSYKDLTLLAGGTDIMVLNEPGRYFYTQLKYKF